VDPGLILRGFAGTFLAMVGAGCLSICISARARTVISAVLASYTALFLLCLLAALPILRLGGTSFLMSERFTLGLGVFALGSGLICLPVAVFTLRRRQGPSTEALARERDRALQRIAQRGLPRQRRGPAVSVPTGQTIPSGNFQLATPLRSCAEPTAPPPIEGDALLWKECNRARRSHFPFGFLLVFWLGFFAIFTMIYTILTPASTLAGFDWLRQQVFRLAVIVLAGYLCFRVAMRAAGCIVRERHQKTLDSLLLLPITTGDLLAGKWLGTVLCHRSHFVLLVVVLALTVLVGAVHPIAAVLVLLTVLLHVIFLTSLGMLVSAATRRPIGAYLTMAIMLVLVFAGPLA